MKATIAGLQALRHFRQQRAERVLAAEQRALEQACHTVAGLERTLRRAQAELEAADATLLQALLGGGLASGHYLQACEEIQALRQAVVVETTALAAASATVAACRQVRDQAQYQFARRQRQLEALRPWLAHEARQARLAQDSYEESLTEERRHPGGVPL